MSPPAGVGSPARPAWQRQRLVVDGLLALVTLIWGGTFLLVQDSIRLTGPFEFLALRFGIATPALVVLFPHRLRRLTRRDLAAGALIGLFLFGGYALQTLALQQTLSSRVGFLTGLNVVFVPLLTVGLLRQRLRLGAALGVALAAAGLGLLSLGTHLDFTFGTGEWLALGCAVCFAAQVVAISRFAPQADATNLALVQIAVTALLSAVAAPLVGEGIAWPSPAVWSAAAFLGLVATAFALVVVNRVQQFTSSTHAALIYALEPVFAGIFGLWAGETLSNPAWAGCGLIVAGMVLSEVSLGSWRRIRRTVPKSETG